MSDQTPVNSPALSARKQSGCSGCFVWMFAIVFLVVGLGAGYFLTFQPLWGMLRSRNWVETPCRIVSSELKHGDDSSIVAIVYAYSVAQKDYQSDRYCFMVMSSNTAGVWKNRVIADHPQGKQTKCFVNPTNPSDAVIERGWVPEMWWGLFPIPFLLVGIIAFLAAIGMFRSTNPNATEKQSEWRPSAINDSSKQETGDFNDSIVKSGPVTLAPESSPIQMLIGSFVFAVFWNGIVYVIFWNDVQRLGRGGFGAFNGFQTLFMIPFVLAGFGLILFVFYNLLALLNPRPTLVVNSANIPLGEELTVNWSFSGRPGSIRNFKISLKGIEKATYQRGTKTTTDKATFAHIEVVETTEMFDMEAGSAKITIPADSMHSFDASNNKIVWTLEVRGEIPWWPDVSASFPITVLPMLSNDESEMI